MYTKPYTLKNYSRHRKAPTFQFEIDSFWMKILFSNEGIIENFRTLTNLADGLLSNRKCHKPVCKMYVNKPTGVNASVGAKAGLLSKTLVTDVTFVRTHFVDQRMHVFLYNTQNNCSNFLYHRFGWISNNNCHSVELTDRPMHS